MINYIGRFLLVFGVLLTTLSGPSGAWRVGAAPRDAAIDPDHWTEVGARYLAADLNTTVYVPTVRNGATDPSLGGNWRTGIQVLNLDGAETSAQVRFVKPDGSAGGQTPTTSIAGGKSQTFFGGSLGVDEGFVGSAVVTASKPIAVIVNQLSQDTGQSGSFNGVGASETKNRVFVPNAKRAAGSRDTTLYLQNAGTATTTRLEVRFQRLEQAAVTATRPLPALAAGATLELSQKSLAELGDGFQGSAVVESDQPLAVVVNESNGKSLLSSVGQATGAATLYGPLVLSNNGGFGSTLQVQNVGDTPTEVTVSATDSASGATLPAQKRTIPPAAAAAWPTEAFVGSDARFVGSVTVQAGSGGQLVGVINQSNPATNQASAYSLFASGDSHVVAPLVQTANSGWNTGFQVQNVGTAATEVTVRVADANGNPVGSVPNPTRTIGPGKSETWFPISAPDTKVVGSAVAAAAAGSKLVGIVNQLNQESGSVDYFTTYEGFAAATIVSPTPAPNPGPTPPPGGITVTNGTTTFVLELKGEWPQRARVELEAAARELAGYFDAPVPITVLAEWKAISGDTVGTGGPGQLQRNFPNAPRQDVLYPPALANQLAGRRLNTTGGADVQTAYNSNTNFYFGRDAKGPTGTEDFYTTVMHEMIHGMGFLGTMVIAEGVGRWGDEDGMVNPSNHAQAHYHGARGATSAISRGLKEFNQHLLEDHLVPLDGYRVPNQGGTVYPDIFDQFVVNGAGVQLIDTSVIANNSPALAAQIQSNNLHWSGPAAIAANGGQRPKLYAPNPFESGSSVGHLDEATFDKPGNPNAILAPRGSNVTTVKVGSVVLGIMSDLGWRTRLP